MAVAGEVAAGVAAMEEAGVVAGAVSALTKSSLPLL